MSKNINKVTKITNQPKNFIYTPENPPETINIPTKDFENHLILLNELIFTGNIHQLSKND